MKGSQLAVALADIVSRKPELEASFQQHLAKWVKSTLMKVPTLDRFRDMRLANGTHFVEWYLGSQSEAELARLAKKLDPHMSTRALGTVELRSHLRALIDREVEPAQKPVRPSPRGDRKTIEEIIQLPSEAQQRMELKKLPASELRAAIKKHDLALSSLSSKPSKTEMVEHILAALGAGWPSRRGILGSSKY